MVHHAASISIDASIASPLILPHGVSGIFITKSAIIGRNVVIFQQVTIGANTLKDSRTYGAPTIGDDIYIIYGKDDTVIRSQTNPKYCSLSINGVYFLNRNSEPYSMVLACADL